MCPAYFTEVDGEREGGRRSLFNFNAGIACVGALNFLSRGSPCGVSEQNVYVPNVLGDSKCRVFICYGCTMHIVHGHVVVYLV